MVEFLSETNLGSVYFRKFKGQALFQETGEKKKKKLLSEQQLVLPAMR